MQIVYSDGLVKGVQVNYAGQNVTVRAAMDGLLAPAALDYRVLGNDQIVIIKRVIPRDALMK
ncbi:MAG: STN domain-containing protein [candidate division KSB1 bacterium]|nr:STN domain-containing protein [candidate division KSB1 bacterium]MDZ7300606.1 STN domain-containing protein [candidate division KSB1 bacterium]MDZ7309743.1 STN domain-containing protein [candidate division KSB1 bacterium]